MTEASETYTFTFMKEVSSLLHAADGNPFPMCVQCGTCSGSCPVAAYMDYTPRQIMAMVNAGLKDQVLESNTFWYCASCNQCTVRCPQNISITELMYALQRYSIWKSRYREDMMFYTGQIAQNAAREGARIAAAERALVSGTSSCTMPSCTGNIFAETAARLSSALLPAATITLQLDPDTGTNCNRMVTVTESGTYNFVFYQLLQWMGVPGNLNNTPITRQISMRWEPQTGC